MTNHSLNGNLTRPDVVANYLITEYITLTRSGAPICWPVLCSYENGRIVVSTGYVFPTKARNAQRNPNVAAFFSDPAATRTPGDYPLVLVQGRAEVFDQDLQHNTERFVDQAARSPKTPAVYKILLRLPFLMQSYVGYMTRIYIEITPEREFVWSRTASAPSDLIAHKPAAFTPAPGIQLPDAVETWLPRYTEPPVLAFVSADGRPAAVRVEATLEPERVTVRHAVPASEGAPACLLYHRTAADLMTNDNFMIRGHFDGAGHLIPEKVLGWQGTEDDRGVGSKKASRMLGEWRKQLVTQLAAEGRPVPVVRLPARR